MEVKELAPEQVFKDKDSYTLVDVREPFEFVSEDGFIEGAIKATLGTDFYTFLENADPNKTYVFICRSGQRSLLATLEAKSSGLEHSFNLKGGMLAWNDYMKSL